MIYRVRIDMNFDTELDARAIFTAAKNRKAKHKPLSNEISYCKLEHCGHDESPPSPCVELEKVVLAVIK